MDLMHTYTDHTGHTFESHKDMLNAWGITNSQYDGRIRHGWSLKDALTTPNKGHGEIACEDHLGNKFSSTLEMCSFWNIKRTAYGERLRRGWTKEEALTGNREEKPKENKFFDHLGNGFPNMESMAKHWGINRTTYRQRITHGWSVEEALTGIKTPKNTVFDHLGNGFPDVTSMCKYWNITKHAFDQRLRRGWTLENALTKSIHTTECKDHLGNNFSSVPNMCDYYKISSGVFYHRLNEGWSLEKALTTNTKNTSVKDHLGNEFPTLGDMCKYYGINPTTFRARIKSGYTIEKALTTNTNKKVFDHLGNEFPTIKAMCKHYEISYTAYSHRKQNGYTLEEILTNKTKRQYKRIPNQEFLDHEGNSFLTMKSMCAYWGISPKTYKQRIENGWSTKDALETKSCVTHDIYDHLGNKFSSITAMCIHYGISLATYQNRLKDGFTVEEALTNKKRKPYAVKCCDHKGNEFSSLMEMCDFWHIDHELYRSRRKRHWSTKDALETPVGIRISQNIGKYRIKKKLTSPYFLVAYNDTELVLTSDEIREHYAKERLTT